MRNIYAYGLKVAAGNLERIEIQRRDLRENDVEILIHYCGICHSDLHMIRNDWGMSIYPMVPGHEIVGEVNQIGNSVKRFKNGDKVGVGCFVDSCRECEPCQKGLEQFCNKVIFSFIGFEKEGKTPSYGGFSAKIVVDENFVLKIPDNLPLDKCAPLLCAGITTYSPLKHWGINPGDKVGIVGFGGLGHLAVKFANAMGADVSVLSTSDSKKNDALRLGAKHFINTTIPDAFKVNAQKFKLIINTASGNTDYNQYLELLSLDGTMVLIGLPAKPSLISPFPLVNRRRSLSGSAAGGIKETQEMLDFCAQNGIVADIELISVDKINEAFERLSKGDVFYRFVIDMKTLPLA